MAIEGDGLFTVRDGADVRYTRDGRMSINDKGELVSVVGEGRIRFLDEAGSPIVVLDLDRGERAAFFAEVDQNISDVNSRALVIRPLPRTVALQ